jgi:hypothetical protein
LTAFRDTRDQIEGKIQEWLRELAAEKLNV